MSRNSVASKTLGSVFAIGIATAVLLGLFRVVAGIHFKIDCGGHLKRAADANTIELAQTELSTALEYLEDNDMTKGGTGVLWNDPSTDVGFWYENLKASQDELQSIDEKATPLERTNVLMKLRETLLDSTQSGTEVTTPGGISIFPHNKLVAFLFFIAGCLIVIPVLVLWLGGDIG